MAYVKLSEDVFASVKDFNDRIYLDIRTFFFNKETGRKCPGVPGVTMSRPQFDKLWDIANDLAATHGDCYFDLGNGRSARKENGIIFFDRFVVGDEFPQRRKLKITSEMWTSFWDEATFFELEFERLASPSVRLNRYAHVCARMSTAGKRKAPTDSSDDDDLKDYASGTCVKKAREA